MAKRTDSPYSRLILVTEDEYKSGIRKVTKPLPKHKGPSQQHKLASSRREEKKRKQKATTIPERNLEDFINVIRSNFPKIRVDKGVELLNRLPSQVWDSNTGQLYNIYGQPIPASDIITLIRYAVAARRTKTSPAGWDTFKRILSSIDIPKFLLNAVTIEELSGGIDEANVSVWEES